MGQAVVYLVGAGPGDPGLLTVAGQNALKNAAVVVYDYLSNAQLLALCPPACQRIYVGKSGNQHTRTQAQINEILVDKARELNALGNPDTAIIVRLKGGDPYVFGRGGEEGEHLHANGIPFVEIPGVTSGIAAPAYAGIPVTHRDFASTITLITGHEKEDPRTGAAEPVPSKGVAEEGGEGVSGRVNYDALARLGGTLVFYMGVKALPQITQRLRAAGMDPQTPAAVIRWGTHPEQKTVTGTLETITQVVQKAGIKAPAITVVGKVVGLRASLNWFEQRPLFGQRFIVTRTRQQASALSGQLAALGAAVLEAPTIEIMPPTEDEWPAIDDHLLHLPAFDWVVFTSANGVRAAWERLRYLSFDARHFAASNVAAIGTATAEALSQIGIVPDVIPEKFVAEELAKAMRQTLEGQETRIESQRFLLLRADIARPVLREELENMGGKVVDVPIYRTVRPASLPEEIAAALAEDAGDSRATWVTFTSASTANNLWELLTSAQRQQIAKMNRASIGPITTSALNKLVGWSPTVEAAQHDIPGLVAAILAHAKQ